MKKYDILALGECLIDFVSREQDDKLLLEGNPGGAPANVLAIASRLGHRTAMVTKVGSDAFGSFLCKQLRAVGIEDRYVVRDPLHPTTLAIVQLDEAGNRSFGFYRDRTADVMLEECELPEAALRDTAILHYGSLSLTTEPSRSATFAAVAMARASGALISYDPNLRRPLWPNEQEAKRMLLQGMEYADLVKISEEEVEFLTGESDLHCGAMQLLEKFPLKLLVVTCGPKGSIGYTAGRYYPCSTYDTPCIDTTGAGDASWGATLSWLLQHDLRLQSLSDSEVAEMLDFANAAGSLATTKHGAIPAMPTHEEIEHCMRTVPRLLR